MARVGVHGLGGIVNREPSPRGRGMECRASHKKGSGFEGKKSRRGNNNQSLDPRASRWMRFLAGEREKRGILANRPHNLQSEADVTEAWAQLVAGSHLPHVH